MALEEVCLRWSNFSSNITKNIDELWKDESLVDVTVCSEGQCIQAHKIILSASSPLFKGIFAVNPCQHPVIILQDVKYRELSAIIKFIYKGEVNIDQQYLPELLKAAHTLQIRGLSDSVGTLNHDEFTAQTEQLSKKRKIHSPPHSDSTNNEEIFQQEPNIIPKQEMEVNECIPPDIETHFSDDEDVRDIKLENSIGEHSQMSIPPHHGVGAFGKMGYLQMPFANLLPTPEVIMRWSETKSLDQLAIDLMKRLFTTEERLICNVNGKMGKPRFNMGKICLLREVLYYYSGLSPSEFEAQWKYCVTKIDTSNRGLKRNKKLRTQMIIKDILFNNTLLQ